jgi:hypothetical protein
MNLSIKKNNIINNSIITMKITPQVVLVLFVIISLIYIMFRVSVSNFGLNRNGVTFQIIITNLATMLDKKNKLVNLDLDLYKAEASMQLAIANNKCVLDTSSIKGTKITNKSKIVYSKTKPYRVSRITIPDDTWSGFGIGTSDRNKIDYYLFQIIAANKVARERYGVPNISSLNFTQCSIINSKSRDNVKLEISDIVPGVPAGTFDTITFFFSVVIDPVTNNIVLVQNPTNPVIATMGPITDFTPYNNTGVSPVTIVDLILK